MAHHSEKTNGIPNWTVRLPTVTNVTISSIKEERAMDNKSDTVSLQARMDKANTRLTNLIAMRADGEISKEEYQSMIKTIDKEIAELQKALDEMPTDKGVARGLDLEGIRSALNMLIDFSGSTISHDVIKQFVYMITPASDTTFDWYVNLNGTADVKATFTAEGRKKNCIIKLEEIEKISSLHRKANEDNTHLIKNPLFLPFYTGSYQLETIIEDAYFLGTYQISKEYMKASAELYHADNVLDFQK